MIVTREAIMSALFAKLQAVTFTALANGATTWVVTSRRLKLWTDVPDQPALFMAESAENPAYQSESTPQKMTLGVEVFVYIKTGDPNAVPAIDLNNVLDGIDAALKPDVLTNRQTLGGLVSHCRIDGTVLKDAGDLDGQGLAVIPLKIFVP